jgi:DNA-binding transcriptional LysR family regulator
MLVIDIDLRLVRYAIAVADELHYGKAAARLGITEQTLSAQIKHFEDRLGERLFVRDRRHVEITAAGRVLVERGRRLLADADEMLSDIALRPVPVRMDVVLEELATPMLITEHVLGSVDKMRPEIREGGGLVAAINGLLTGDVDIAFGSIPVGKALPGALTHIPVRLQPISLLLPSAHPLASLTEIPMSDLKDVELVFQVQREMSEWQAWQESLTVAFGCRIGERVNGHGRRAVALTVLRTGQPTLTMFESTPYNDLTLRPLFDPVPLIAWSMLWRREHRHPRIDEIVGLVQAFVSQQGWLTPPEHDWWMPSQKPRPGGDDEIELTNLQRS